MKKFTSGIGTEFARVRRDGPRKPSKTLTEMAEEFGVTRNSLSALIGLHDGPKPLFKSSGTYRNTWYDPTALRAWWNKFKAAA